MTAFMFPARTLLSAAFISISIAAHAQTPTKAQQDAVRSNCRSDFMANCSSVTPGGREALMCLEQNKAKLSSGCQAAVNAIAASAAPKPAPAPAKSEPVKPEPAAAPAAPIETAPTAPTTKPPAAARPAPPPRAATAPVRPAPPPKAAPAQPVAVPPSAAAPGTPKPVTLTEAAIIRRFCFTDFRVLCRGVQLGGGRAIRCLAGNGPALSPGCRQAMVDTGELAAQ